MRQFLKFPILSFIYSEKNAVMLRSDWLTGSRLCPRLPVVSVLVGDGYNPGWGAGRPRAPLSLTALNLQNQPLEWIVTCVSRMRKLRLREAGGGAQGH